MNKGNFKQKKDYLSIILVPHSLDKVKVLKFSSLYKKLAALLAFVLVTLSCTGIFIAHIINQNRILRNNVSTLQSLNVEQKDLLNEKINEISRLKVQENEIDRKVSDFINKYREMADSYISSRIDSKASRSGDRDERSFSRDIIELKNILSSLNELNKTENREFLDLTETENKLKKFLESIPTFRPAVGRISSEYGERRDPILGRKRFHEGIDIAASYGEDIKAAAKGTVVLAKSYNGYGRAAIIDHGHGITTLYGHTSELLVKEGQIVNKGEVIAKVGSSGRSTGPHLHFEIRINNEPVDPLKYLDK